jgi:hypothetical protein
VEPASIDPRDIAITMGLVADIKVDVRRIRRLLEDEDGEEEEEVPEPDA